MKTALCSISLGILGAYSVLAGGPAVDSLTQLPLPAAEGALQIVGAPMDLSEPVCKSTAQMNFYTVRGKVDAALSWYATHLGGFKHVHGYNDRSQDTFYNADGTLIVAITGKPAPSGVNSDVGSVIYGTIKPGVSEKIIAGLNVQKLVCP